MNQISNVLARFGSVREAAGKIGRAPSVIQYWKATDRVPANAQNAVIEAAKSHGITIEPADLIPGFRDASGRAAA